MTTDQGPTERLKTIWRNQLTPTVTITNDQLAKDANRLQSFISRALLGEYIGAVFLIAWAIWFMIFQPGSWLTKTAMAALILSVLLVAWGLHRRQPSTEPPTAPLLDFRMEQLSSLRDATRSGWRWFLAPLSVPVALLMIDRWFLSPAEELPAALDHQIIILIAVTIVLANVVMWLVNLLAAARLQRHIDYLEAFREENAVKQC